MLINHRWNGRWLSWQISRMTFACTIWMTSFAVSGKWSGNSEQVFINQRSFRPPSIGKHNSVGHLLPRAIDFKTNHPPIHLQWIGKLGIATEPRHVISMGLRQPEVPGEAIVCSDIWRVKDFKAMGVTYTADHEWGYLLFWTKIMLVVCFVCFGKC